MKLPILSRFRGGSGPQRDPLDGGQPQAGGEHYTLAAEIPGATPGKPLWRMNLELVSEPQGEGERLRLRAHLQTNFASGLAHALDAPSADVQSGGEAKSANLPAQRIGRWLQRRLENPLVRRLAEPLLRRDFHTWIELRASTADLLEGTKALLPETERLKPLGIEPVTGSGAPVVQTWAGRAGGLRSGHAQVSLVQIDKRHLPARLAAALGEQPFQLAAAVVNVVEEDHTL